MCAYVKNQIEGVSMFSNSKCESSLEEEEGATNQSIKRERGREREREKGRERKSGGLKGKKWKCGRTVFSKQELEID